MSRMSKADEATSWRRPLASKDAHSTPSSSSKTSSSFSHRPASAGGSSSYSRMMQQQQQQVPPMRQPVPASFNVVEAQALLDHRWKDICQQGLQPACQCKEKSTAENAAAGEAAANGEELAGKHDSMFLQELKAAADSRTADGAWDDP